MSTTKTILLLIGVVVLAGIVYTAFRLKESDKDMADYVVPELQIANIQVTNLTADKADMTMHMVLDNPAPAGIRIDSLHYVIYIEDKEVARTTYPDSLQIEASDSTSFDLPLTVYYDKLLSVLDGLEEQGKDSVLYRVDATVFSDMAVLPKDRLDLEIEKRLPLLYPPEIRITGIGVEDVGLSGATLQTEVAVTNKNNFDLSFENMSYSVQLDNNEPVEGNKPGITHIPANGSATISIPAELEIKGLGKNLIDLLRKGDDVRYSFHMKTDLVSDSDVLEESEINLSAAGRLEEAIEAAKTVDKEVN